MIPALIFVSTLFLGTTLADQHAKPLRHRDVARRMKGDVDLHKRQGHNGRFTFYAIGQGACGQVNHEPDAIVALNSAQYGGGYPGPNCFKWITLEVNGKQVDAQIMDECPTCGPGDLDLSKSVFNQFASDDVGVVYGNWWFKDGSGGGQPPPPPPPPPTTSEPPPPPPTSTSQPPPPPPETTSTWSPPVEVSISISINTPTTTTSDTWTPPPPTSSSSSSSSSSLSSSSAEPTMTSSAEPTSSAGPSSTIDYSSGYNSDIAVPTGTVDPEQAGNVYEVNQAFIGFGGLIRAGLELAA